MPGHLFVYCLSYHFLSLLHSLLSTFCLWMNLVSLIRVWSKHWTYCCAFERGTQAVGTLHCLCVCLCVFMCVYVCVAWSVFHVRHLGTQECGGKASEGQRRVKPHTLGREGRKKERNKRTSELRKEGEGEAERRQELEEESALKLPPASICQLLH